MEALQQEHEKLEATARVRIISVLFLDFGECSVLHVFLAPKELQVLRQLNGAKAMNVTQCRAT